MDLGIMGVLPLVAWVMFIFAMCITIIYGGVLAYHWYRFGMNHLAATMQLIVFTSISFVLLGILLSATLTVNGI